MKQFVTTIRQKFDKFHIRRVFEPIDRNTLENPKEKLGVLTTFPESRPLKDIEKELTYPIKICGTRKESQNWFWAWDISVSMLVWQSLNPYLYLTFKDKTGKIIGPIRYHSRLIGWGAKIEFAARSQMGRLSGYELLDFYEIPKKIEVQGQDMAIGAGIGNSYTRLRMPGVGPDVLLQYFGVSSFGGFGFLKIKKGTFEAEDTTCQYGFQPWLEAKTKWLVLFAFIVSTIPYILQILSLLGYF